MQGIKTGIATFETSSPQWDDWNQSHFAFGRIATFENNQMLGWAALIPVSSRCVYGGVAEVSIYVSENSRGKNIGKRLLIALIKESEDNHIWTLQSSIFRQNIASLHLHLKCGFRQIGYKEKIGLLNGIWYDNILLERRSNKVGI